MERNINNIDNVIKKLILIDGIMYIKCKEKLEENKIKIDMKDYTAYITKEGIIHFGKDFFKRPVKEQLFILVHEMMHEILEHISRFQNNIKIRKNGKIINIRNIINIATDLAINSILKIMIEENNKIATLIQTPSDALLPSKFNFPDGKSAEYYLIEILKNLDKILNNNIQNFDKHEGDFENENKSKNENGEGENRNKNEEEYENKENIEEIIDMDNENVDEVIDKIEKIIKNSNTNTTNKNWDEGDGLIKRIIERIMGNNTITWRKILRNDLISFSKVLLSKYEERIDRKNMIRNIKINGLPIVIPTIYKRIEELKINVYVFIDTSGSISNQELTEFIYQITKIIEDVNYINDLNIYLFSENIYYQTKIEIKNKDDKENIKEKIREIGKQIQTGGTSFKEIEEIFNSVKENGYFIVFTDGYAEMINIKSNNKNKRFIWIIANNKSFTDKNNPVIHIEV